MGEYLAPGVYVEEIDSGNKPIEGVSTSTTGMVGVTVRGPVNVPMLVTSFAEFRRQFGGYLDYRTHPHTWYLPHAVEGFFQNGGKRLWVTRVAADQAPNEATNAEVTLTDRGERSGVADTRIVAPARQGALLLLAETTAGLANNNTLRLDDGANAEYVQLAAANAVIGANTRILALRRPLDHDHANGVKVRTLTLATTGTPEQLAADVAPGDTVLLLDAKLAGISAGLILRIEDAGPNIEYAIVGSVPSDVNDRHIILAQPLARNHAKGVKVQQVVENGASGSKDLAQGASAGDSLLVVKDNLTGLAPPPIQLRIDDASGTVEYQALANFNPMSLRLTAYADHTPVEPVTPVTFPPAVGAGAFSKNLARDVQAGSRIILLDDRGDLAVNDRVQIGTGALSEYHVIASVPANATDKSVTLLQPLASAHATGAATPVVRVTRTAGGAATSLVQGVSAGDRVVFLADTTGFGAGTIVEIGDSTGTSVEYQVLDPAAIGLLALTAGLAISHDRDAVLRRRDPLLRVRALDQGDWGNQLTVIADDDMPLLSTTVTAATGPGLAVPLASAVGLEIGSVVEIGFQTNPYVPGTLAKVTARNGNNVTFGAAGLSFAVAASTRVRTREFKLTINYMRNNQVLESETFRQLSLDDRHSRYAPTIIGDINGPPRPSDRRPLGSSNLVRVHDQGSIAVSESATSIRLAPDRLVTVSPSGQERVVGRWLAGGTDLDMATANVTYMGVDDIDPTQRTGIFTLKNQEGISLVAVPGRTDQDIQQALIDHCEEMRYRFAVLDSTPGSDITQGASVTEIMAQRSLYDTKYAALYYPWLIIPDPFPANPQIVPDFAIPSSGHILGIYAQTDADRGVHKAPANIVVNGIRSFQRNVTKGEQEILNPGPENINVLRDFRLHSRGLRVWGARCITSDPDWKYVNVRRLFIFLEASIDQGTQWVVFEPNDYQLWARVRQSVTNFLTRVWHDGALMGTKPEEAFFVKCDATTMTQDDIDNGRLIMVIGIAPVKPAEFVIIRIGQKTGGATDAQQ